MKIRTYLAFLIVLAIGCQPVEQSKEVPETLSSSEDLDSRIEWWRDAGFGMFIHWGPYAVPAGIYDGEEVPGIGEWIMNSAKIPVEDYEEFSAAFNPTEYDASEWVRIAKDAGMKYIIITSKHHDGFCLWDSEVTDYDVIDFAPVKRDLLEELREACEAEDIKLGFYHSIMDWHHPDAQAPHFPTYNTGEKSNPRFPEYYRNYLKPQVGELVRKYNPAVLWFDGEWIPEYTHEQGQDMYKFVRSLKPDILINNRVDKGRQGMQGMNKEDKTYAGDFGTPEQEILEGKSSFDWESCMTMNDTWGYKAMDDNWKSAEVLIHNLVDIVAKGGNYLLNVGPTAEGLIPAASVERLAKMGEWMRINSEAIYNTRSMKEYREGESTYFISAKDGSSVYVVTTRWPGSDFSFSNWLPSEQSKAKLLGYGDVDLEINDNVARIIIPETLQDETQRSGEYAWVFKFSEN